MKYLPDTYLEDKRVDNDTFLELQFKYRKGVSLFLSGLIDFKNIDEEIKKDGLEIPVIEDHDYNFYHRGSSLGSNYIYLRNNVHIERLSDEELKKLLNNSFDDLSIYVDTYEKVLYEDGDYTSYGLFPNEANTKKSKALLFEFAFDQTKCKSVDQIIKITNTSEDVFSFIDNELSKNGIETDFLLYQKIPEAFKRETEMIKK